MSAAPQSLTVPTAPTAPTASSLPSALAVAQVGFEAARRLPVAGAVEHRTHGWHGHGFRVQAVADVPRGWPHMAGAYAGGEALALHSALYGFTRPWDHTDLGQHLPHPCDGSLAMHLLRSLPASNRLAAVAVSSTARQGAWSDASGRLGVWRRQRLSAAHRLPHVPPGHKCGRMHGHSFEVELQQRLPHCPGHVAGDDPTPGAVVSAYDALDAAWMPIHAQLDHRCLNEVPGLDNPTSEHLAAWVWRALAPQVPGLHAVNVLETGSSGARFDGTHFRIWKQCTLDCATQLTHAPLGHPTSRLHGHTMGLRLHLQGPLDAVLGWAVDFGDVKAAFDPIFKQLDHHDLRERMRADGLADGDATSLATWALAMAEPALPQLVRVDAWHAPGLGAVVQRRRVSAAEWADAWV